MTADPQLLERLSAHKMIGSAPREELEWLATHGTVRHMATGEVVSSQKSPVESMYIVLEGHIAIYVDRGAGPHKMMEWRAGDITGTLPYSRMSSPPGDTITQEPTMALGIHRDHFVELTHACPTVTARCVHLMVDRARAFTSNYLHDEKMVSLGKLSAGLAHELNNPASAIERSAAVLRRRIDEAELAARTLGAAHLNDEQLAAVNAVRESCLNVRTPGVRSPIEEAEREEEIMDWLMAHGLDAATAEPLADTSVTIEALDRVAAMIHGPALDAALRWAASGCSLRALSADIQEASTRISVLVLAIKGFTHMDHASVAEPVDVKSSLNNTITVLRSKAKGRSASVTVDVPADLPPVRGFAGELNQIWANLIDNALDAIPDAGKVEVRATREPPHVVVRIADNGSGIPKEIRDRIFEPFFTTKPMGHGTGLGLDIVRRLVRHNDGDITVESQPGRTVFRVALPVADGDGGASR